MHRKIAIRFKFTILRIKPKILVSIVKSLLFMFIGHWLGCVWSNKYGKSNVLSTQLQYSSRDILASPVSLLKTTPSINNCSSWFECPPLLSIPIYHVEASNKQEPSNETINLINIGFVTDGKNAIEINEPLKTLFLHRQSFDFLSIHILAPKSYWPLIDETLTMWYNLGNGLTNSFNYTLYNLADCTDVADVFQPYFDSVYRIAFCKLVFPYLLNPVYVPYLFLMDFDTIVLSNRFTSECWLQTIKKLNQHPFAIFSVAHQGSPVTKRPIFPMPYLQEYKAHFHFNNGIILFHIARIHALDQFLEHDTSISAAYPVASGPRRWLRDLQQVTIGYLKSCRAKHSLTQVLWNVYMAHRSHSFVHLNQACNFQPCAQQTYVKMWDDYVHFPNIIISHLWRVCKKRNITESSYFNSYYQALAYLPINYVNRINPTRLLKNNTSIISSV